MKDRELTLLEQDLAAVSGRLAAHHPWRALEPRARRRLRRPYWTLAGTLALVGALAAWGRVEPRAGAAAVALLVVLVPDQLAAARERRRQLAAPDESLFASWAREAERRFVGQTLLLLFGVPLVLALLVVAAVVPDPRWPLALAGALAAYLPFLLFVRMRRSARESHEAQRWARQARAGRASDADAPRGARARPPLARSRSARRGLLLAGITIPVAFALAHVLARALGAELQPSTPVVWSLAAAWVVLRGLTGRPAPDDGRPPAAGVPAPAGAELEQDEPDEPDEDQDDDDDDDDDEGLALGLARGLLGLFVLYLGPPLVLLLLVLAAKLADPTRALVAAGLLAVAWVWTWRNLPEGDEDEDEHEDGGDGAPGEGGA